VVKDSRTRQQLLAAIMLAAAGLAFSSTVCAEGAEPPRPNSERRQAGRFRDALHQRVPDHQPVQPDPLQRDYGKIPAQYGSPGVAHGLAGGTDHVSRNPETGRLPYRGGRLDRYVGLVVEELRRQGVLDGTCIMFMADNGRPFPRCKTQLYDNGIKAPFVVRWPDGFVKPGSVCNSLASVIDIAPTVLDLAGLKPPP